MSAERRKQRLTWEALGDGDPTVPGAEALIRTLTIVGLVLFIVLFSGSFGGG
jgi:hypothetical protein